MDTEDVEATVRLAEAAATAHHKEGVGMARLEEADTDRHKVEGDTDHHREAMEVL